MTRIEVTETELSLLHDLLEADRHQARALILKDSKLARLLTRSDRLMEEIRDAKARRKRIKEAA